MKTPTLYQWPPALGTESIYPRCVVFRRICNIAQQPLEIVDVSLPTAGPEFSKELSDRLIGLPVLEVNGERYTNSHQILEFLIAGDPSREIKAKLLKMGAAHSFIIQQWANESFINSLVYARWKREANFQRFIKNVRWARPSEQLKEEITLLRQEIIKYLKRSPIGRLSEEQFNTLLKNQLWSLEHVLSAHDFMEPMIPYPTLTDLNVFMVVQGLLSPDLDESQWIKETYPHVYRWAQAVEQMTAVKST